MSRPWGGGHRSLKTDQFVENNNNENNNKNFKSDFCNGFERAPEGGLDKADRTVKPAAALPVRQLSKEILPFPR